MVIEGNKMMLSVLTLLFAISAPTRKELPQVETEILGEWKVEQFVLYGIDATPESDKLAIKFSFVKGNKLLMTIGVENPDVVKYRIDALKKPAQIDFDTPIGIHKKDHNPISRGIFKLQDGVLTICINEDEKGTRPGKFDEEVAMKFVLKRAQKK